VILVDTSVWVSHLRYRDERLSALLTAEEVLCHPFIIGEIALGHLRQRSAVLGELLNLPRAPSATDREVLRLIEDNPLYGCGIGYVDAHLLASARMMPDARLWTADRRLKSIAAELGLAANLPH